METDGADGGGGAAAGARAPVDGVEYPVMLGPSLLREGDSALSEVYSTFRYDFQPASIDTSSPGLVSMDESKGVQVLLASSTGTAGGVLFKGKVAENKDTDCLLLFDGSGFRLERCPFSCTQLRHVRAATAAKRKMDSAAIDLEVAAASGTSLKPGGSKKAKATGRPRGRPPKAKLAPAPKKPRTAATKVPMSSPPTAKASGSQTATVDPAPPPS
jgi:ELL-associated factor